MEANVLFLGSRYWCSYLAGLLNDGGYLKAYVARDWLRWLRSENRSICLVGLGMPDTYKRFALHFFAYALQKAGFVRRRVIYWIGSDVLRARPGSRIIASGMSIAGSSWLAEEVSDHGYPCAERLFPVRLPPGTARPFPETERLQVLCYVPDASHELHGSGEIRFVAERLPDVDFRIIGGTGEWWPDFTPNVRFTGWTDDVAGCIEKAHLVLRRTAHDSLSAFVREGLVAGRFVIFTYDVPGVIHVGSGKVEALVEVIGRLNRRFARGGLRPRDLEPTVRDRLLDTDSQLLTLASDYD
jgi:hypothetical protein